MATHISRVKLYDFEQNYLFLSKEKQFNPELQHVHLLGVDTGGIELCFQIRAMFSSRLGKIAVGNIDHSSQNLFSPFLELARTPAMYFHTPSTNRMGQLLP